MELASQQRKNRDALTAQRAEAGRTLIALQVEAAGVEGQRKVAAADLGPVIYLAELLGVEPDVVVVLRWFVLLSRCCSIRPQCCC
jgi:hypothetical protein